MGNLQQIKQLMQMVKSSKNPQAILQTIGSQNPQFQQAINLIRAGNNPRDLFYALAKQKGVDPNIIIQALQ